MTEPNPQPPEAVPATKAAMRAEPQARKPAPYYGARDRSAAKKIALWLYVMCGLVALMVTVGGATRLTDSGLSITQWDLIIGTLPPMGEEGWMEEFEKYRQIPEYERVNKGMSLEEFKFIYWWEWGHRNLGRFIGLAFLFPLGFFIARGYVKETALKLKLIGTFLLICAQGALGWYMVSSGLVDRVDVSQYRLAAHLGLAVILFGMMLWMALRLDNPPDQSLADEGGRKRFQIVTMALGAAVFLQVILGAFVAGLRAGKAYTTWPLMNGEFFPSGYFIGKADFLHAFETMAAVQFNHRMGAYALLIFAVLYWRHMAKAGETFRKRAGLVFMAVFFQGLLGIWTVVTAVPISLGLLHQLGALVVLSAVLYNLHKLQSSEQHTSEQGL